MERQTILERLGWRFIRIRGSEFYRDREKTIERVISELTEYGIEPENALETKNTDRETDLLKRVKRRANFILNEEKVDSEQDFETVEIALDPNKLSSANEPSTALEDVFGPDDDPYKHEKETNEPESADLKSDAKIKKTQEITA